MDPGSRAVLSIVVVAGMILAASILRHRRPTAGAALVLAGTCVLALVAFAHVCEAFHLFPALGWGSPDSVGHSIDLVAAISGSTLLVGGLLVLWTRRGKRAGPH